MNRKWREIFYAKRKKRKLHDIASSTFSVFLHCFGQAHKVYETITFLLVTLPNIHRFKKFTLRLNNKPFLIWLLTTRPHLKYTATLSCNLSLMACFADINVSQSSVATYARCGGIFNPFNCNYLPRNLPGKNFLNRLRFDRNIVLSLWPCFLAHPVYLFVYFLPWILKENKRDYSFLFLVNFASCHVFRMFLLQN